MKQLWGRVIQEQLWELWKVTSLVLPLIHSFIHSPLLLLRQTADNTRLKKGRIYCDESFKKQFIMVKKTQEQDHETASYSASSVRRQ